MFSSTRISNASAVCFCPPYKVSQNASKTSWHWFPERIVLPADRKKNIIITQQSQQVYSWRKFTNSQSLNAAGLGRFLRNCREKLNNIETFHRDYYCKAAEWTVSAVHRIRYSHAITVFIIKTGFCRQRVFFFQILFLEQDFNVFTIYSSFFFF